MDNKLRYNNNRYKVEYAKGMLLDLQMMDSKNQRKLI